MAATVTVTDQLANAIASIQKESDFKGLPRR